MTPRLYTPQEVSNLSGRSANFIQAEIRAGRIAASITPAGKAHRFWVSVTAAQAFIAQQRSRQKGDRSHEPSNPQPTSRCERGGH